MNSPEQSPASRPTYAANLQALLGAQKPARGTAAYSRLVNRPAGRRVAAFFHVFGLTPNQATALSALSSGAGIVLLALGPASVWVGVGVAVLLASGYVLDSVDGQLARLRGGGSVSGEWLDHTIDCFKTGMLQLAVLIQWYRHPPVDHEAVLLLPVLYQVVATVTYFNLILMPFLRASRRPQTSAAAAPVTPAPENPWRTWLILPTDYGFVCWTFVLLGWHAGFLTMYAALTALNVAMLSLALRKWWRELKVLDRLPA